MIEFLKTIPLWKYGASFGLSVIYTILSFVGMWIYSQGEK